MSRHVIEVLYGERCPLVASAIARVRTVLATMPTGIDVEIRLIRVDDMADAIRRRCHGSPTVRVDGVDVDPRAGARPLGTHARGFYCDGVIDRVPPEAWIRTALDDAIAAAASISGPGARRGSRSGSAHRSRGATLRAPNTR